MDEKTEEFGFKPQKETPYNKFLPYADKLDSESTEHLAEIKAQLGRTLQLRDVKIGASHWTGQLSKYIRLYGLKFSKEDHLTLIDILYELTTIPDLEYSLVQKFAQLLISLLKKKGLLSRDDLVLPWRPLYKLVEGVVYSPYEHHGLVLLPGNIENVLKNLVRVCRVYFSVESTAEMLAEWRPLLCPFDMTMMKGIYYLDLFLPTLLPPDQHHIGFKLWFDELIGLWEACQNSPSWEGNLVHLFARLSVDCGGYVDWEPYIPIIFTRVLRSFNLPVGTNDVQVGRNGNVYEINPTVWWIVGMLGGGSSTQQHLDKLLSALESFYHPSNFGRWMTKLLKLIHRLPLCLVKRLHRERYKETWEPNVLESHRLTNVEVTHFVKSMLPVVSLAMFSKQGSHNAASAFQHLASLRAELVVPLLLDKLYPALETLIEPHRLIACLQCTVGIGRSMVGSTRWYPEGRSHVLPLLNLCLPGIDPNDVKKCLMTFQLVSTLASLVPIVDCSQAVQTHTDLTEEEVELCSSTAQFEDFVLQFLDRIFTLIENSSHEMTRGTDSATSHRLNHEEMMLEVGLLSTFNSIMQQSSSAIFKEALSRLRRFVTSNVLEIRVAGRYTSDLVRAAAKVNAELTLKAFLRYFCNNIIHRTSTEDLSQEEHLDNEFLWNLKLLSELVRCDGQQLLTYREDLEAVLHATLHLRCKDASELAGSVLRYLLKSLSLTYALDYRSSDTDWDDPDAVPIREWGKAGRLQTLTMKWHVPTAEEIEFATDILKQFLLPELNKLDAHTQAKDTMSRDDLKNSLNIVLDCIAGAGSVLDYWHGPSVHLIDSLVELKRFSNTCSSDNLHITMDGKNVRQMVSATIRPLLDHMLSCPFNEDDTKSLIALVKVYSATLLYSGIQKDEFDQRWKSLHIVKKSMENRLVGKKNHIRALLVDRIQLQHELRISNRSAKVFTSQHGEMCHDLYRLSTSRYSAVRKVAQQVLGRTFQLFAYSYRSLLKDVLACVKEDPAIEHHQFKGALYLMLGQDKRSLVTKRSWEIMADTWPALVKAQHSEKPSVLKLIDAIIEKLHKNVETPELAIKCTSSLDKACSRLWSNGSLPSPSLGRLTEVELQHGAQEEDKRNHDCQESYHALVDTLVKLIEGGNLRWKNHQMALEMLTLLIRHDTKLPAAAVHLFVTNMVHETLQVRKICISAVSAILKQQKRKHPKKEIDPYKVAGIAQPADANCHPGDRPDNAWLFYDGKEQPLDSKECWDSTEFVGKTHIGYYTWPRPLLTYAAFNEQPLLDRSVEELSDYEQPIAKCFSNRDFVDKFVGFLSLEENKGKDKFHSKYFTLFKGLFRNFGDQFLPLFRPHLERLVADTTLETHECSHRLAAELISGIIRGSKHWGYDKTKSLWDWLLPIIRTGVSNISVACVEDWGTCFATASESRDPKMIAKLLDMLMDKPLSGEGGSFGDASRLYILQGALAQQEWRVPALLHSLATYLRTHMAHLYKNVRDRIGSVLVNIYLYDICLPNSSPSTSPRQVDFIASTVLPELQLLMDSIKTNGTNNHINHTVMAAKLTHSKGATFSEEPMEVESTTKPEDGQERAAKSGETTEDNVNDEEREHVIRLCKTVMKWLQGSLSRMFQFVTPDIFQFLPILCSLVSETQDDELRRESQMTLACMAQAQLQPALIPHILDVIAQVSQMGLWHARAAILGYSQVMVFCNLFLMQHADTRTRIQDIVITLLCDEQLEVREMAAMTLGGFLHCGYLAIDKPLLTHFEKLSRTKIKKKKGEDMVPVERILQRHAGVLGLSACVQAFPYDVPEFVPDILMTLSNHVNDPQPIQMTVKKTLSNFKRTHHDNWQDHKQKFTDDQLVVLTDLLVSPNYYA